MDETAPPILVKRYGQGRLYDPGRGCYVSVEQLRAWAASGRAVSVMEADGGEDVTAVLLA